MIRLGSGEFILTSEMVRSYLKRLGIRDVQPPNLEFLCELHRAHVSVISWQTIDVFSGRPRPIDMETSVRMIMVRYKLVSDTFRINLIQNAHNCAMFYSSLDDLRHPFRISAV